MLKTRVQNGSIYDWFTDEYQDRFEKVIREYSKEIQCIIGQSVYGWMKKYLKTFL